MARKPHPADDFNAGIVANATSWSAFMQAGGRITRRFQTRDEARRAAQVMADGFRRPALVYAIDAQGRTAVADTIHPSINQPTETPVTKTSVPATFAKRFNAQRAARKALGADAQEGTHFRTHKVEGGFTWEAIAPEPAKTAAPIATPATGPGRRRPQPKDTAGTSKSKQAAIEEAARRGELPTPPDFSAATHVRFRTKLAKLVAMAEAGDATGLKAVTINPVSTSPRAMARYRDLAVIAIEARVNPSA